MKKVFSTRNLKLATYLRYENVPLLWVEIDSGRGIFVFEKNDETRHAVERFTDRLALVEPHRFLASLYDLKGEVSKTVHAENIRRKINGKTEKTKLRHTEIPKS